MVIDQFGTVMMAVPTGLSIRSERLVRLRPVLVRWHEARPFGCPRRADPDLSVRVHAAAPRRRNRRLPSAMQQASVGDAAFRMCAAIGGDLTLYWLRVSLTPRIRL